ncbi:cell division protein FtsL [Rheinheimera pacifica]|nr:cell division protein FtsL [Rheinheimera pacifica]
MFLFGLVEKAFKLTAVFFMLFMIVMFLYELIL